MTIILGKLWNRTFAVVLICVLTIVCEAQTIIKSITIDQCTKEEYVNYAVVRRDSSIHYMSQAEGYIPLFLGEGAFDHWQHSNDLPYTKIAINDTIYDTLYTTKLNLIHLVSNPPISWYDVCGEEANGTITDYYCEGKPRIKGAFENGQPVDTVFRYYYSSSLYSWVYAVGDVYGTNEFYENGVVKRSYLNTSKARETEYYQSGVVKEESYIRRLGGLEIKQYYTNGNLKTHTKNWSTRRYSSSGALVYSVEVSGRWKQILRKQDFVNLSFNYLMELRDSNSNKHSFIYFKGHPTFLGTDIENLSDINIYNFEKAVFHNDDKETHKITNKYISVNGSYQYVYNLYSKSEKDWVQVTSIAKSDLWETIRKMSSTN
jgi:hypothetical protein